MKKIMLPILIGLSSFCIAGSNNQDISINNPISLYYKKTIDKTLTIQEKKQLELDLIKLEHSKSLINLDTLAKVYRDGILKPKNLMKSFSIYDNLIMDTSSPAQDYLNDFLYSLNPEDLSQIELAKIKSYLNENMGRTNHLNLTIRFFPKDSDKIIELLKKIRKPRYSELMEIANYYKTKPHEDSKIVNAIEDIINSKYMIK